MKILQWIQNDLVVNFNDDIRIAHCALNIELTQLVAILTLEWILQVAKSKKYNAAVLQDKYIGLPFFSSRT